MKCAERLLPVAAAIDEEGEPLDEEDGHERACEPKTAHPYAVVTLMDRKGGAKAQFNSETVAGSLAPEWGEHDATFRLHIADPTLMIRIDLWSKSERRRSSDV